jgi:hypothetical protein
LGYMDGRGQVGYWPQGEGLVHAIAQGVNGDVAWSRYGRTSAIVTKDTAKILDFCCNYRRRVFEALSFFLRCGLPNS